MTEFPAMIARRLTVVALAAATALLVTSAPAAGPLDAAPALHLQLDRSAPEAEATVSPPSEVRLWFSQAPQASATSARLIRDGEPVETLGELKADPDDATVFVAPVEGTLPDGTYTVAWRAMAADGHVVRGDFPFTVRAP